MKKLALITLLVLGISACSMENNQLPETYYDHAITMAKSLAGSEYCSQAFSTHGKDAFFREQYQKNIRAFRNYISTSVLSQYEKQLNLARQYFLANVYGSLYNIKDTNQALQAYLADPNREEKIKNAKAFSKGACIEYLEKLNTDRKMMNQLFIEVGRNDLIVE